MELYFRIVIIHKSQNTMKRMMLLTFAILLGLSICIGQSKGADKSKMPELPKTSNEAKNKPQTNIKVNKEYDNKGNMIRYDSTYSWSYSSDGTNAEISDSMMNEIKSHFNQEISIDDFFSDALPQGDSVSNKNSDLNAFFASRFRQNMEQMDKLFSEMDSTRNKELHSRIVPEKKKSQSIPKKK
jgi:hypothetical protein